MGNRRKDIVYGNLFYIFIFMKTKCKFLVEENQHILILKKYSIVKFNDIFK